MPKFQVNWWEKVEYSAEVEAESLEDAMEAFQDRELDTPPKEVTSDIIDVEITTADSRTR